MGSGQNCGAMTGSTRQSLLNRLADGRFGILSAPAGFGKTTAIHASLDLGVGQPAADDTKPAERAIVWAQLGSIFRTDAPTVAQGLVECARQLGVADDLGVEAERPDHLGASACRTLTEALHAVAHSCTLVLDDLQLVPPPLQSEIAGILRRWPDDRRHVLVSTRDVLSSVASCWPIHDATVVVRPRDLLLDHEQIAEVLGPDLAADADRVAYFTGGWAHGVEVMQRHLATDPTDGAERAESVLHALIAAEIVPRFDDDDLDTLTTLALCDAVPASVVERASGGSTTARRVRELVAETGFVTADSGSVGLIPVFRQALVRWITTSEPDGATATHLRFADAWLDEPASASSTVEAVHHLLEAGAFERAVEVLQLRWGLLYTASRVDVLVDLLERTPVRYWAHDPGCALLAGWANLLTGRGTRALELLQSPPLRTPVGAAIKRLVWAQGVWWSTGPAEAVQLVAEGRARLDELAPAEQFPNMPGNDDAPAFHIVADGAEIRARFLLGDLGGSIERLDVLVAQPTQLEPISVAGLHAVGALIRAFRGDRIEALAHLGSADSLLHELDVVEHYVMLPGHLARALLAVLAGDTSAAVGALDRAVRCASDSGAANFLRLCDLVADLGSLPLEPPRPETAPRTVRLPLVDSSLPVRAARRRADLGDSAGAAAMLKGIAPNELTLSAWVHVLMMRHPLGEVRSWLAAQPEPTCPHGQVIRLVVDATVADNASAAVTAMRRAVEIASDARLLGVIRDAPAALWERPEIDRLDLPLLADARRLLQESPGGDGLRFTTREIEMLRMLARSATAAEIAGRLFVSVNTVKWHKANIYRKLGVSGSRLAVERAVDLGILDADDLP
jgi:LuxR family maltose regulon positive regulatory protein